jgi:hypothetical protein
MATAPVNVSEVIQVRFIRFYFYRSRDLKCSKAEIDQISKGNFFCFFFFAFVICEIVFVPRRTSRSFCLPAQSFLAISFEEN